MEPTRRSLARRRLVPAVALAAGVSTALGLGIAPTAAAMVPASTAAPVAAAASTWHNFFSDEFNGTTLGARWSTYSGHPTSNSVSTWTASRVKVGGGVLTLSAVRGTDGTWTTGGIGAFKTAALYGRFTARIRFSAGQGLWAAALLFPVKGWPPEMDYYEIFAGDAQRRSMTATTHAGSTNRMQHNTHRANYQAWHVISMIWSPTSIRYLVDGKVFGTTNNPSMIPHQPMWPAFQLIAGKGAGQAPTAATPRVVKLQVAWFRIAQRG